MIRAALLVVVVLSLSPLDSAAQLTEQWYQEACDAGAADACNVFGVMYEVGEGVQQNLLRAAGLYEQACEGGVLVGCTNAGRLYQSGAGVPQNIGRANDFYRIACDGGELLACDLVVEELDGTAAVVDRLLNSGGEENADLATGQIVGRVMDEADGAGLADVEVAVLSQGQTRTLSNQTGRFDLAGLEPGLTEIGFTRLGYAPRSVTLVVLAGRTVDLSATMSTRPIELDAIAVTVRSRHLERSGFYARANQGLGNQFSRNDLESVRSGRASDVLSRVAGLSVRRSGPGGTSAVSLRGQGLSTTCALAVYVDGLRMALPYDLDQIPPDQLEAMEVYRGVRTPIEYQSVRDGCGVILFWTRR